MLTRSAMLQVLPPFRGNRDIISEDQTVRNIVQEVLAAHEAFASHYDRLADLCGRDGLADLPERLYRFCRRSLIYREESQKWQTTRSPAGILAMQTVDCKHYAGFIGGWLDAVNRSGKYAYDWEYRFCSYDLLNFSPGHVFVVVKDQEGKEVWIDPVPEITGFNSRNLRPIYKWDKCPDKMTLVRLSGVGKIGRGYSSWNVVEKASLFNKSGCIRGTRKQTAVGALSGYAAAASIGSISAPAYVSSWAFPDYSPAGSSTPYGKAGWIPQGYPAGLPRPYINGNHIILRPWTNQHLSATAPLFDGSQQATINMAYLMAALQGAVNQYSPTPYNVNYTQPGGYAATKDLKWWAALPALGSNQFAEGQIHMGNDDGDINWMNPPPSPSGLDYIHDTVVQVVPSLITSALNSVVPGLGTQLQNLTASPSSNPSQIQQIENQITQTNPITTPIAVAPVSPLDKAISLIRSNPVPAALAGAGVVALLYALLSDN